MRRLLVTGARLSCGNVPCMSLQRPAVHHQPAGLCSLCGDVPRVTADLVPSPLDTVSSRATHNRTFPVQISTHTSPSSAAAGSPVEAFLEVLRSAFPDNVFVAAYNMNVLGVGAGTGACAHASAFHAAASSYRCFSARRVYSTTTCRPAMKDTPCLALLV